MKKTIISILGSFFLFTLPLMLSSCGTASDEETKVSVKSISLNKWMIDQTIGDAPVTLTVLIGPEDATNKNIIWKSSDTNVATVTGGVVTFVGVGTATITVIATNGTEDTADDLTDVCEVTVRPLQYAANEYREGSWDNTEGLIFTRKYAAEDPILIDNEYTGTISSGWYTVTGDNATFGKVGSIFSLTGDTHIILCDGASLTLNGQINGTTNYYKLYIYGQNAGTGKLIITTGREAMMSFSLLEIHGGEITATSTKKECGAIYLTPINIYGGKLTAQATNTYGFGIRCDKFNVYGGEVIAIGIGDYVFYSYGIQLGAYGLTVYGGKVTACCPGYHAIMGEKRISSDLMWYETDNLDDDIEAGAVAGPGIDTGVPNHSKKYIYIFPPTK